MDKNKQFVIAINRELGSGGRTVGEKLAARLGVPFYDKALIRALEEKYNLSVDEIERLKGRNHSWWAEFKRAMAIGYTANYSYYRQAKINEPDMLITDEMFQAEQEILLGIAQSESCIIAGRSGFHVFRNHPNHLSIFIQAPMEQRIDRIMKRKNISHAEAEKIIMEVDHMRENYVQKYTGTSRYDTRNYDLVISMAGQTEDSVVDLLMRYIQQSL